MVQTISSIFKDIKCLNEEGVYLAGGALRKSLQGDSLQNTDYDFYFKDIDTYKKVSNKLKDPITISENKFAIRLWVKGYELNLIKKPVDTWNIIHESGQGSTAHRLINDFHFTVCQLAMNAGDKRIVYGPDTKEHLRRRQLIFVPGYQHRFSSVALVTSFMKYVKEGYTPNYDTYKILCELIKNADVPVSMDQETEY